MGREWGRDGDWGNLGHGGSQARAGGGPLQGPGGERRGRVSLMSFLSESQRRDQHPQAGGLRDSRGKGPGGVLAVGRNLGQCPDS